MPRAEDSGQQNRLRWVRKIWRVVDCAAKMCTMAYYNYKRIYSAVPADFQEAYEAKWKEENGAEFEGTADYDGDLWCLAADYIEHLKAQVDRVSTLSVKLSAFGYETPVARNIVYALRCALNGVKPEFDVNGFPVDPAEKCCPECDP